MSDYTSATCLPWLDNDNTRKEYTRCYWMDLVTKIKCKNNYIETIFRIYFPSAGRD